MTYNIFDSSFFDVYKENNCDVQCRMKKVIDYCECLPYYFRHVAPDVETCNFTQIQCLVNHYCTTFHIEDNVEYIFFNYCTVEYN